MHIGMVIRQGLFLMPFAPVIYLVLLLFLGAQYQRAHTMERSVLGIKIGSFWLNWLRSLALGLLAGLILSVIVFVVTKYVSLTWSVALSWEYWAILLLFCVIDVRLADISYVGPTLVVALSVLQQIPKVHYPWLPTQIELRTILLLTGAVQLVSGVLGTLNLQKTASPLYLKSRRGQVVGMFVNQLFWPIPLLLPMAGAMVPLAVMTGFGSFAIASRTTDIVRKKRMAMTLIGVFGILAGTLWKTHWWEGVVFAIAALLLRISLLWWIQSFERNSQPLYVRPARGVRILATIPKSPAEQLGLLASEIILKIGNMPVNSPYDVHFAIDQNPAYVKLEVVDERGESRFIGTPLFAGGPSQLGVVVVPDEHLNHYREAYEMGEWNWLWRWWAKRTGRSQKLLPTTAVVSGDSQSL